MKAFPEVTCVFDGHFTRDSTAADYTTTARNRTVIEWR